MGLVGSIIIGFLMGIIAKLLMPEFRNGLFKITEIIGSLGAVIAFEIGTVAGIYRADNPAGYIASLSGAFCVLALYRWFSIRQKKRRDFEHRMPS